MKKNYKRLFLFAFFLFLIIPIFNSNNRTNNVFRDFKEEDLNASTFQLDSNSLSINYGDDLEQDRPYNFTGTFYNDSDYTFNYDEDCYLESQLAFDSEASFNDSFTPDNIDNYSPEGYDFTSFQSSF